MLLTNCPSCILSLEKGLELMRGSGEPTEFGIIDFYRVFSRALGEGGMGQRGFRMEGGGCRPILTTPDWKSDASMLFGLLFISEADGCRRRC